MLGSIISGGLNGLIGAGTAIVGGKKAKKEERALEELERNRPKYKVAGEYASNKSIAASSRQDAQNTLKGQDTVSALNDQQSDISAADATTAATQSSNSSGGILSAISNINKNTNASKRDNALDAAGRLQQKQSLALSADRTLMQANEDMAEEKDKEFDYNVNQPYQNQVDKRRKKASYYRGLQNQGLDTMFKSASQVTKGIGDGIDAIPKALSGGKL